MSHSVNDNFLGIVKQIEEAGKGEKLYYRIAPGKYEINPGKDAHIILENLGRDTGAPFIIDASGVELVCRDYRKTAIKIYNCRNIMLKGLSVGYSRPCMTQGEVVYLSDDGKYLEVVLDDGYPHIDTKVPTSYVYNRKTRQMKNDTPDMYSIDCEQLDDRKYRIFYNCNMKECNVEVGDVLGFRTEGPMAIIVEDCERVTVKDVLVTDGCFAILEIGGEGGNVYDGVTVTYKEKPEGARYERVLSTYADSFHSALARRGPTIVNCHFEGMGDDCINIHGSYGYFAGKADDGAYIYASEGRCIFDRAGDSLRILDVKGCLLGETEVAEVLGEVTGYKAEGGDKAFVKANKNFRPRAYFKIKLAADIEIPFGARLANPDRGGRGFKLLNNRFGPNRARGTLIKADDGLIEGNTFQSQSIHSILVSPEYYWNESCFVRNLIIRNNTFINSGFVIGYRPAIIICGEDGEKGGISHRNIIIENNVFRDNNAEAIHIEHTDGIRVQGNDFGERNAAARDTRGGYAHIKAANSINLLIRNNTFRGEMEKLRIKENVQYEVIK